MQERLIIVSMAVVAASVASCSSAMHGTSAPPPESPVTTPIYRVQGSGSRSPMDGQPVIVVGVVTGDFQDTDADPHDNLGGFFVQSERPDGDGRTSDGVFVYDGDLGLDVRIGDRVEVRGRVEERFDQTRIAASGVTVIGTGAMRPTDIHLPGRTAASNSDGMAIADLERFEGMLVRFPQTLTVIDAFNLERFGELLLGEGGRPAQFTNGMRPDAAGFAAHQDRLARATIVLDDGSSAWYATPPRYLYPYPDGTAGDSVRLGDQLTAATGNLLFARGAGNAGIETYRLMPVGEPAFVRMNARPASPPDVGGDLTVMSLNALNFFTTRDSGLRICGPTADAACRGAQSEAEFDRQRSKLIAAIRASGADIVGLMEIENNATRSLASIVDGLNADGDARWSFIDTGAIGTDAIKVGLIFDSARVTPAGRHAVLDSSVDARFDDVRNRPALAQTFAAGSSGGRVTVAVNHLKSKGSACDSIGDPDVGDGQGNCNRTRTAAATALADWLAIDPTASADGDVLVIGDLNAYLREDPLEVLTDAGFANLLETFAGPDEPYSYVFGGATGALDHALASSSLLPQVTGAAEWHINADEPPLLDYNLDVNRAADFFDPSTPFRASDHDPILVGLELTGNRNSAMPKPPR